MRKITVLVISGDEPASVSPLDLLAGRCGEGGRTFEVDVGGVAAGGGREPAVREEGEREEELALSEANGAG